MLLAKDCAFEDVTTIENIKVLGASEFCIWIGRVICTAKNSRKRCGNAVGRVLIGRNSKPGQTGFG